MPGNMNVTASPALIYSPSPAGTSHVFVSNQGRFPVYIGQSGVTAANGLPLYPNNVIDLANCPVALYGVSPRAPALPTAVSSWSASVRLRRSS